MIWYPEYTVSDFLESKCELADKYNAIIAIIAATELLLLQVATGAGGTISSYELDDQQVRIKTTYRSIKDITESLKGLEILKQRYYNQLRGRTVILMDKKNLRGGFC